MNQSPVEAATFSLGILGYPLAHTISPALHQAALDHCRLQAKYQSWPTPPDRLSAAVELLRGPEYLGANVTVPYKEAVRPLLDALDPWAKEVGAVNTIVRDGDRLVGHNTDAYGFLAGLKRDADFDPRGKRVLIIGAGGAARAAVFGLAGEGVASIAIANRTLERAKSLVAELGGRVKGALALPLDVSALGEAAGSADLVVNCTSMGMRHGGAEGLSPLSAESIPEAALVCDMVYTPRETPLIKAATAAGARSLGGLAMLVYQGAAAFELWTGKKGPVEVMRAAAQRAMDASEVH